MSTVRVGFIPFGAFEPDLPEFDNPSLEEAKNLVPAYGTYRPVEELRQLSLGQTHATPYPSGLPIPTPLVGGYAHLTTKDDPKFKMVPYATSVDAAGRWYDKRYEIADASNDWHADLVNTFKPDDSTWVRSNTMHPSTPDLTNRIYWKLKAPKEFPTSATFADYVVKVRVQSWWPSWWTAPKVVFGLHDRATDTEVCLSAQALSTAVPAAGPNEVEEFTYALSGPAELALITDWDQVEIFVEAYRGAVENIPAGEILDSLLGDRQIYGWAGNGGEIAGLYEHARYRGYQAGWDPPEDVARVAFETDWIVSPPIYGGEDTPPYIGQFQYNIVKDPEQADIIFLSAHMGATDPGVTCKMQLLQTEATDGEGETSDPDDYVVHGEQRYAVIAEIDVEVPEVLDIENMDANLDGEERILALTPAQVTSIDPDKALYASFVPSFAGGSTGTTTLEPTQWVTNGWGGAIGLIQSQNNSGITSGGPGDSTQQWQVDAGPTPDGTGNVNVKFRMRSTGAAGNSFQCWLRERAGALEIPIKNTSFLNVGTGWATYTMNVPFSLWAGISDWSKLEVKVKGGDLELDYAWITYSGENSAKMVIDYVHGEESRSYSAAMSVTGAWFEVPPPRDYEPGDRVEVFTGDDHALWRVSAAEWEDLTNYTDWVNGYDDSAVITGQIPRTWSFCSWGDWVIASNYVDPVQYYDVGLGTGEFDDLITSTEKPQGRFVAVVGAQLVLADINPTSTVSGTGEKYQLWSSSILDPTKFFLSDYNSQSSLFSLVGAPGQITGLVGGEYGLVFKRNSIWRMSYEGLPSVFRFDQLSRGEGTPYASSIVQVDNDTYFWGSNGIFVIREGKQIERVSGQRIEKFLYDVKYEDRALYRVEDGDERVTDNMVQGAYDRTSGLIWWSYRKKGDEAYHNSMMLVYNHREDKFSFIEGVDTSVLIGLSSAMSDAQYLNEGLANIRWKNIHTEGGPPSNYGFLETFTGLDTYVGSLKTKVLSSQVLAKAPGYDMAVQAVRPIYKADPDSYTPNFSINIVAAQDPSLQINRVERTVDRSHEDSDGWISTSIPVGGEFYQFEITVPKISSATIKEILGLGFKFTHGGKY